MFIDNHRVNKVQFNFKKVLLFLLDKYVLNETHLDVKPINPDPHIVLVLNIFFACIELLPLVNILAAGFATHIERSHKTNCILSVFGQFHTWNLRRIEIRRIIFLKIYMTKHKLHTLSRVP